MEVAPTTTIQDPSETREALTEARKRLLTGGGLLNATPPQPARQAITDPPRRPPATSTRVAVATLVAVALALATWVMMR